MAGPRLSRCVQLVDSQATFGAPIQGRLAPGGPPSLVAGQRLLLLFIVVFLFDCEYNYSEGRGFCQLVSLAYSK